MILFQMTKARLKVTEEDFRSLKWEHEVLEQRFEKVSLLIKSIFDHFVEVYIWIELSEYSGKQV